MTTTRETADHAELLAKLKTNDPTNPAHRLARDLQVNAYLGSEARDDLIEVLSEIAALRGERRNIVSHATMGATDGEGLTVNAVSVEITRLRNAMHASYHTRATQSERQRDELRKALELAAKRFETLRDLTDHVPHRIACSMWADEARQANQGADQ